VQAGDFYSCPDAALAGVVGNRTPQGGRLAVDPPSYSDVTIRLDGSRFDARERHLVIRAALFGAPA
jgi:hypothetical protein